jgi:hypothetical protein
MAGDVVNKWLLDYICFSAWEEFKNDKTLSLTTIDLISGIIKMYGNEYKTQTNEHWH